MKTIQTSKPSLGREALFSALAFLGVVFLSLFLFEFAARTYDGLLTAKYGKTNAEAFLYEYDPLRGWKYKPGTSGYFVNREGRIRAKVTINSKGLRDEEMEYQKPAGTKRILLLDASAVAGFEVEQNETLDVFLEALLAKHGRYQVINGAHRAYGTDQNLIFLKEEGIRYEPDLVIYVLYEDDFEDNFVIHKRNKPFGKSYFIADGNGNLELRGIPVPRQFVPSDISLMSHPLEQHYYDLAERNVSQLDDRPDSRRHRTSLLQNLKQFLYNHSIFYRIVTLRIKNLPQVRRILNRSGLSNTPETVTPKSEELIEAEYEMTERLIREMKDLAEEHGAKLLLYHFSNGNKTSIPEPLPQMAQNLGVPYIESLPEFRAAREKGVPLVKADAHWNKDGHRFAAEIIYNYLVKEGWVS